MKKLSLLFCAALIGFSACKKDEDTPAATKSNNVTHNGTSYKMTSAYTLGFGGDSIYNIDLIMFSSGVTAHSSGGVVDSISGSGSSMYFELWTDNLNTIKPGVYTLTNDSTRSLFQMTSSDFSFNYNYTTETGNEVELKSCVLTVNSSTVSSINIDFTGMTTEDQAISGHFAGAVSFNNYSEFRESQNSIKAKFVE